MEYIATKLQPIKSYPTYQLHAFTANDKLGADKDDVCDWARKNFSGNIIIAPRAESALRKYSGALRIHRDDYEVLVDGDKYLLDMHIKYGVSSQVLVRIYFCWDEKTRKIVIGYMPEHLATATKST